MGNYFKIGLSSNNNLESFQTYVSDDGSLKINIYDLCYITYPCQHDVSINYSNPIRMAGDNIKNLFLSNNMKVPEHFDRNWRLHI